MKASTLRLTEIWISDKMVMLVLRMSRNSSIFLSLPNFEVSCTGENFLKP